MTFDKKACKQMMNSHPRLKIDLRWTPHPVIVTIRDKKEYVRVLLNPYYPTITGWGVLIR